MNRFSLFCFAVVLVLTMSAAGQSQVLVPGNPPLTEEMIGRFAEFFEWAFDVGLTSDQCNVLRKYSVDIWNKQTKSDMDAIVNVVQLQVELSKVDRKKLAVVRANYEPQVLASMRKQPNEPMAVWALAVYESSHKILAPGNPPLTRQGTDAFLEALFFMAGEVSGQQTVPDQKLKNDWAQALAANYSKMSAEMKQQIAEMPLWASAMRMAWPELSGDVKAKYRALWAEQLKSMLPAAAQAAAAEDRAAGGKKSSLPAAARAPAAGNRAPGGKKSVAEMMAEQNRRHQKAMQTSAWMMDIYKIKFNTQANWSANPNYRYW